MVANAEEENQQEVQQELQGKRSNVIVRESRREREIGTPQEANRDRSRSPLNQGQKKGDGQEEIIYISSSPTSSEMFGYNSSLGDLDTSSVSSYQSSRYGLSSQVLNSDTSLASSSFLSDVDSDSDSTISDCTERVVREDNETGRAVRALQMESFSDADIDEEKILLELMVPQSVSTPKRHPLAPPSTARYSQEHLQQLTPLLHDHSWVDECEVIVIKKTSGLSVREALARAGVCLTAVIMETLKICPFGFHLQSQDQWHSKNQLTARALRHIMPRLGLMDYEHENYKKVYNSIQRFSGTYIFLKHALDHGDFPEQLHELQRKAVQLRFSESNSNPELERCVSMRQCLALQYAPTDLSVTHDEFGENVQPSRNGVITTLDNNTPPPGNDQRGALRLRDVNQIDPIQHAATSVVKGIRQENQQSPLAAYYADAGLKENQTISNIHAN